MSDPHHEPAPSADPGAHAHGASAPSASVSKAIGATMASCGVMLALCAAMVGSQRTELLRTMVEQSSRWSVYQSTTMKYRVMQADHQLLSALTPKRAEVAKLSATLRQKRAPSGHADDEDTAEIKDLVAASTEDIADLATPDAEEKDRFATIAKKYAREVAEAKEDAEAYEPAIHAHENAAEGYEHAQLAAEFGLVVASVALLLGSRVVWAVSILLALASAGVGARTFVETRSVLAAAERHIEEAAKNEAALGASESDEAGEKR